MLSNLFLNNTVQQQQQQQQQAVLEQVRYQSNESLMKQHSVVLNFGH